MKKNKLALLPLFSALVLVGCGDDSASNSGAGSKTAEDGSSVETIYDLGACTLDREGDVVLVEDEGLEYLCHKKKWEDVGEPESSDSADEAKSSSSKKKSSSSKDKSSDSKSKSSDSKGKSSASKDESSNSKGKSSDSEEDPDDTGDSKKSSSSSVPESSSSVVGAKESVKAVVISKKSFKGVAEKGPFVVGSTVRLSELDEDLDLTGTNFEWEVTGNQGDFVSPKVSLTNQYAQLQVSGGYYNENYFKNSTGTLTLRGLVDLDSRDRVNINVLMHLIYKRVVYLFTQSGKYKNVPAAKAAAEQEIMKAFGFGGANHPFEDLTIFGTTSDDAKLLAASILLQGDLSESELLTRLTSIANNMEKDGKWNDDEETRIAMADWIMSYSYGTSGIRQMLEDINEQVPDFEKYVSMFVGEAYGLGECNDKKDADFVQLKKSSSANLGQYYVCEDGLWRIMYSTEKLYENACTAKKSGTYMTPATSRYVYVCNGGRGSWSTLPLYKSPKEAFLNSEVTYGKIKDSRDGKEYKTVVIGSQTWMAENLNYFDTTNTNLVKNAWCYRDSVKNCDVAGRLYTWTAAMDLPATYQSKRATSEIKKQHRGICPEGWHIPDSTEWYTLANYVYKVEGASGMLKSSKGWEPYSSVNMSKDPVGFSAIPTGAYYGIHADPYEDYSQTLFDDEGYFANFWTATEGYYIDQAVYAYLDYRKTAMGFYSSTYNDKDRGFSVRCVEDVEIVEEEEEDEEEEEEEVDD